jgi:hypothetical protein
MRVDVNAIMTHGRDLGQWKDRGSSPRVQRSAHCCLAGAIISHNVDDEAAIVAVGHVSSASAQIEISTADDCG